LQGGGQGFESPHLHHHPRRSDWCPVRSTLTDRATLLRLEESLWQPDTRFDRAYMERILSSDFTEFGRSGRRYTRAECLAQPAVAFEARLTNVSLRVIDRDTVLVTYVSEVEGAPVERANRASIWSRDKDGWRLRFHQGTAHG
jgi:hypothetical protein